MGNLITIPAPFPAASWNYVRIFKSATYGGAYVQLGSDIALVAGVNTSYYHEAGLTTDWYQYAFYDSNTSYESSRSANFQASVDFCSVADVQALTGTTYTASTTPKLSEVQIWCSDMTSFVKDYTGRNYQSMTATAEKHSGDGTPYIMLDYYPIITITSLVVDNATLVSGTDYWIADQKAGVIECLSLPEEKIEGDAQGHENITVSYTYGAAAIPASIKDYTAALVAMKALSSAAIANTSGGELKSYSDGDVSLTYNDGDKVAASLIANYERLKTIVPVKVSFAIGGTN